MNMARYREAMDMNNLLRDGKEFVVCDLETTGLSPSKFAHIIEIGAVKIRDGEIIDSFQELIKPPQRISQKIIEHTGITNEMVEGKRSYYQVLADFYRFLGNAIFVAHNATFDWDRFLLFYFDRIGVKPRNKVIDTLLLSKFYFPQKDSYRLDEMCKETGVELLHHHRALSDAEATANILLSFKKNNLIQEEKGKGQLDVFDLTDEPVDTQGMWDESNQEKEITHYSISKVRYWEPSNGRIIQRVYVQTSVGTVYYDINKREWFNKDVTETINFEAMEQSVLKFLHLKNTDELCEYRTK